jgi:hypothetical protein
MVPLIRIELALKNTLVMVFVKLGMLARVVYTQGMFKELNFSIRSRPSLFGGFSHTMISKLIPMIRKNKNDLPFL